MQAEKRRRRRQQQQQKHNRTLKSVFETMLVAVAPVQHIRFVAF